MHLSDGNVLFQNSFGRKRLFGMVLSVSFLPFYLFFQKLSCNCHVTSCKFKVCNV